MFDANQYYRLINLEVGGELSLDVDNPETTMPNGSLSLQPTGKFQGQIWQILESTSPGHYFMSTAFLGAKMKLDAIINERGDWAPQLRNFTEKYNQTWSFTRHTDAGNRTTWTVVPDFLVTAPKAFSIYNDSSMKPYLAPLVAGDQVRINGAEYQRWLVSEEGKTIDDPTFSATHLPALATEAPVVPEGEPTVTPTTTASVTATPTAAAAAGTGPPPPGDAGITGPLIAAAVVPSVALAACIAAFFLFLCVRRRKIRRQQENSPYPTLSFRSSRQREDSTFLSEILDTFVDDPAKSRRSMQAMQSSGSKRFALSMPSYLSMMSSNLSGSLRSQPRVGPLDSATSGLGSPLSAPPPRARLAKKNGKRPTISIVDLGRDPPDPSVVPAPLPSSNSPNPPRSPKSPKWPRSPWMATVGTVGTVGEQRRFPLSGPKPGAGEGQTRARERDSLDLHIYDSLAGRDRHGGRTS